jgi:NADPH:quinone reductase-like Zn-dependent oxidoreductase
VNTSNRTMLAVRLRGPGGAEQLALEEIAVPIPAEGEALIRVHAAALTRDELEWPVDRLPATPSYELSGVVAEVDDDASGIVAGDAVYALSSFDRDGAAAEFTVVPARFLAPAPQTIGHVEAAAIPLAGLSAWQALFDHGRLVAGERVLVHGAAGGVGHFATQLARERGAHVIGTATGPGVEVARELGAHEVVDRDRDGFTDAAKTADLIFDTVGGDVLAQSAAALRARGRLVSVASEPPPVSAKDATAIYFIVEPNAQQLTELARLVDAGAVRPAIDSVFPLSDARAAFGRVMAGGKRGKVVLRVVDA